MRMDITPDDGTFYSIQYQANLLMYMDNKYYAKLGHIPVITPETISSSSLFSCTLTSRSGQCAYNPNDMSSNDEKYLMPKNVAEMPPARSHSAARLMTPTKLCFNSPPDLHQSWGQVHQHLNDHHSDPREFSSTFWIPDITIWWLQQGEMYSKYPILRNVACNLFSNTYHAGGQEDRVSVVPDLFGWRQSTSTGETLHDNVNVRLFPEVSYEMLTPDYPPWDTKNTENELEMKLEPDERILHRRANFHCFWRCCRVAKIYVL